MTIDILCKVVDNFGDIGVVYRLAKALSELDAGLELRLLVDDLSAFRALCPSVEVGKAVQTVNGWTVAAWAHADDVVSAPALFRAKRPRKVIECFACGRPDWYEDILFDEGDQENRLIVDLEYLTAENWAIDFHRLPSATRSAKVRKAMFMPGFVKGTGGLIHGGGFLAMREAYLDGTRRPALRGELLRSIAAASAGSVGEAEFPPATEAFWVTVFSYERDFRPIIRALAAVGCSRPVLALAAAGKSSGPSLMAWEAAGRPFPFVELPFLNQETWDETILASDFSIVRGEDSLSRAALSGRPFLWHAYALQDGAQVAKVRALLDNLKPFFAPADFALIENLYLKFNGPVSVGMESVRLALVEVLDRCGGGPIDLGFRAWSENLLKNGNLAEALLTFIRDFG